MPTSRRAFVKGVGATAGAIGLARLAKPTKPNPQSEIRNPKSQMPTRSFGKTGWKASIYALGSAEMPGGEEAIKVLNRLIDAGVNYFDTAPSYVGTRSESTIGQVMKTRRKEVFLATKTLGRTADAAYNEVNTSLKRLQTDHVDLLQVHAVNDFGTLDTVLAKGGAVEGLERARKEGLIKHIGITGHTRPEVISKALDRYPFDAILVAVSAIDASLNDFADEVLPKAKKLGIGITGMKALKGIERAGGSFDAERFLRYVWSLPVSTVSIGLRDLAEADKNLAYARAFKPMSSKEMGDLKKEVARFANDSTLWWKRR